MAIFLPTAENLDRAASIIKSGGIVSFPTETVYGLGADAFNPTGVATIFEVKNRPFFDPIIIHIADISDFNRLALIVNKKAEKLAETYWPGPLTIVLKKSKDIPDIVTSGLDTVAVRMPNHEVALDLIKKSGTPVAAPSANPFGYISPTKAEHVFNHLGNRVDMILDGGDCSVGVESTIIKFDNDIAELLRPGGIPVEDIEDLIGKVHISEKTAEITEAPGMLPYHYSPVTPVKIVDKIDDINFSEKDAGFILFKSSIIEYPDDRTEVLSPHGDMKTAAANIFSSLHELDKKNLKVIYAERVPGTGLGRAIMDRLVRASK